MPHTQTELSFEQQQEVSKILENFRDNPSNSNKYRYELFAYINDLLEANVPDESHTQTQDADELQAKIAAIVGNEYNVVYHEQTAEEQRKMFATLKPKVVDDLMSLIIQDRERAYEQGYNDNARYCYCDSPGATEGVLPHRHLMTNVTSSDIRPELSQLTTNKEGE